MRATSHSARGAGRGRPADAPRRTAGSRAPGTIAVWVNGSPETLPAGCTLAALVRRLGIARGRAATVVNGEIVVRSRRRARALREGDRVDVLTLAGGG